MRMLEHWHGIDATDLLLSSAAEGAIIAVHSDSPRAAMAEESRMARMDAAGFASNAKGV